MTHEACDDMFKKRPHNLTRIKALSPAALRHSVEWRSAHFMPRHTGESARSLPIDSLEPLHPSVPVGVYESFGVKVAHAISSCSEQCFSASDAVNRYGYYTCNYLCCIIAVNVGAGVPRPQLSLVVVPLPSSSLSLSWWCLRCC